jgi:protease-4
VHAIAESRDLDSMAVVRLIDAGPYSSKAALAAGLVDSLLYPDELESILPGGEDGPRVTLRSYLSSLPRTEGPVTAPRIAVVHATGAIVGGKSGTDPVFGRTIGSDSFIEALEDAEDEDNVKAIVVRVDSPGGEVYASHLMWRAVKHAATDRPVVASFSDLAASGGYYLAMGADTVVADNTTITGSIGVVGGKFNISGLYDKLGMTVDVLTRGENAQFQSPFRNFTPAERERYLNEMFEEYRTFLSIVAANRGLSEERIDSVARGRVWTGGQAWERGLVDEIGGLEHAIDVAKGMAGIPADQEVRVVIYPKVERTFLQQMATRLLDEEEYSELVSSRAASGLWHSWFERPAEYLGSLSRLAAARTLAILPFRIEIR